MAPWRSSQSTRARGWSAEALAVVRVRRIDAQTMLLLLLDSEDELEDDGLPERLLGRQTVVLPAPEDWTGRSEAQRADRPAVRTAAVRLPKAGRRRMRWRTSRWRRRRRTRRRKRKDTVLRTQCGTGMRRQQPGGLPGTE